MIHTCRRERGRERGRGRRRGRERGRGRGRERGRGGEGEGDLCMSHHLFSVLITHCNYIQPWDSDRVHTKLNMSQSVKVDSLRMDCSTNNYYTCRYHKLLYMQVP